MNMWNKSNGYVKCSVSSEHRSIQNVFGAPNRQESAPSWGHHTVITLHLSAILTCLFRNAWTTRGALSPQVIQKIAALNVPAAVLWHYKLTVAFIKQEMKRGTANIGIWPAVRIPINSRCHCGHVGLSCANEWALQLSAWWIRVNAVSSWTAQHAGGHHEFTELSPLC